jgi:hypothetical protein
MLNPGDERDLAELICDEYSRDIDAALKNPLVAVAWGLRGLVRRIEG